jgi:Ribbon-helix-helix domain
MPNDIRTTTAADQTLTVTSAFVRAAPEPIIIGGIAGWLAEQFMKQISLNLEPPLWLAFRQLATERRLSNKGLLEQIYAEAGHYGPHPSITSVVRSYLVADLIRRVR